MSSARCVKVREVGNLSSELVRDVAQFGEPCYLTENGKAKAVLMDVSRYNALMDLIEESEMLYGTEFEKEQKDFLRVHEIISQSSSRLSKRRSKISSHLDK